MGTTPSAVSEMTANDFAIIMIDISEPLHRRIDAAREVGEMITAARTSKILSSERFAAVCNVFTTELYRFADASWLSWAKPFDSTWHDDFSMVPRLHARVVFSAYRQVLPYRPQSFSYAASYRLPRNLKPNCKVYACLPNRHQRPTLLRVPSHVLCSFYCSGIPCMLLALPVRTLTASCYSVRFRVRASGFHSEVGLHVRGRSFGLTSGCSASAQDSIDEQGTAIYDRSVWFNGSLQPVTFSCRSSAIRMDI
ncbi:hypothetical protein FISHEDRAFT_79012 [Fistulina hepatica ATCC 64428]|uniref:Uncharacterized protein n=1 Tax=Fistulina hepatica ATCC 64428 TaxID=1128425 RepID=A0A0D6ZYS8_9AGAR|nr:hypothetical protein FISHEDRAFT_79012 [Fistulina hepatica ATCC 64428]